jgi:16S rRNA (cytosine1402-N4)-methyltransferase
MKHIPVLEKEVLDGLNLSPGASVIDATVGLGGHAALILEAIGPTGRLYAFDRDGRNLKEAKVNLAAHKNVEYFNDSFANMNNYKIPKVDGILYDLGFSSVHVDDALRGFSFQKEGPLDMRYDRRQSLTAEEIVNGWSREDLTTAIRQLGEDPLAPRIAKAITDARKKDRIVSTTQLADIISDAVRRRGRLHPATLTFQALRMIVNDEMGQIKLGLDAGIELLKTDGRIAVISFHSHEDRLVKQTFKTDERLEVLTKRPLVPSRAEQVANKRARSSKLRIARKK